MPNQLQTNCYVASMSIVGREASTGLVTNNVTNAMTKSLHAYTKSRMPWYATMNISQARVELQYWYDNIEKANEAVVDVLTENSRVVYSDTSSTGNGGFAVDLGK